MGSEARPAGRWVPAGADNAVQALLARDPADQARLDDPHASPGS